MLLSWLVSPSLRSAAPLWALAAIVAFGAGCNDGLPKTVPVTGRIMYGGDEWPAGGKLTFTPTEPAPGFDARPGQAEFTADGAFTARAFDSKLGLVPGTYKVAVECWEVEPTMDNLAGRSHVPPKYQNAATSDLIVDIGVNDRAKNVVLDVPKPPSATPAETE